MQRRQEFVIGGWTPSDKRSGFRSLLLGAWEDGKLVYHGRVGTGFDDQRPRGAERALQEARAQGLALRGGAARGAPRLKWVEPKLVAEIAFTEFTSDGILRHPSFLGLREDKKAKRGASWRSPSRWRRRWPKTTRETVKAGVRITHPGRVVYPDQGLTKGDLIDYYEAVADLMLPHVANRPLSLVRCPQGPDNTASSRSTTAAAFPKRMHHVAIAESSGEKAEYFYIDDLAGHRRRRCR